jgi:hypothetical protein
VQSNAAYLRSNTLLPCVALSVRLRLTNCNCTRVHMRPRPTLERSTLLQSIVPLLRSSALADCYIHARLCSIASYLRSSVSPQSAPTNQRQLSKKFLIFFWGNYILPPEVSANFHFCLQSLKCDTLPPQTFKLWQFNPFSLFILKMPPSHFKKKKHKKKI